MRTLILTAFSLCFFLIGFTQEQELLGEWQIFEFSNTRNGRSNITNKTSLDDNKSIWTMSFAENGEFNQSSNMRTGEVESQKGSWKTLENELELTMSVQEREITIPYQFTIENDKLILSRSNPTGTIKLKITFEKV